MERSSYLTLGATTALGAGAGYVIGSRKASKLISKLPKGAVECAKLTKSQYLSSIADKYVNSLGAAAAKMSEGDILEAAQKIFKEHGPIYDKAKTVLKQVSNIKTGWALGIGAVGLAVGTLICAFKGKKD